MKTTIDHFYLDIILNELRMMNETKHYGTISYNSLLYLDIIAYTPNCTVSTLAQKLHIAKSAVTSKVHELERLQLVEKIQSNTDKRVFYLNVTPEISKLNQMYDSALYHAIEEIDKTYTTQEKETFCKMVQVLSKHFAKESNWRTT